MARIGINCLSVVPGELGGAETYLVNLIRHLAQMDRMNDYFLFVSPENRSLFEQQDSTNFSLVECPIPNAVRFVRIAWEQLVLPAMIQHIGLDMFHSPGNTAPLALTVPLVLSVQSLHVFKYPEMFSPQKRFYLRLFTRLSVKRATRVIAVSSDTKSHIVSLFSIPESAIDVVYEGVGPEFHPQSDPNDNQIIAEHNVAQPFILCPSTLYPYKNIKRLLQAFGALKAERGISATLVVVGGDWRGQSKSMKQWAKKLDIVEDYKYLGMVPYSEMPALYRKASLVVYPSLAETFGLPLLESMACGTPVACSDRTSLPEVGGQAVRYFDPTDAQAIADAVYTLLTSQTVRDALVTEGLVRIRRFTWTRTGEATLETYRTVLAD